MYLRHFYNLASAASGTSHIHKGKSVGEDYGSGPHLLRRRIRGESCAGGEIFWGNRRRYRGRGVWVAIRCAPFALLSGTSIRRFRPVVSSSGRLWRIATDAGATWRALSTARSRMPASIRMLRFQPTCRFLAAQNIRPPSGRSGARRDADRKGGGSALRTFLTPGARVEERALRDGPGDSGGAPLLWIPRPGHFERKKYRPNCPIWHYFT